VYSYNFPDDKRYLKALGGSQTCSVFSAQLMEELRSACFVFLLETSQTALTGADVYYWFMAGFGDLSQLKKSIFGAIDIPTIDAIISLIVQWFYCYRIWVLNKQSWWISLIIAIVRPCPRVSLMLTTAQIYQACCNTSGWSSMGWDQGEYPYHYTPRS
jgi:hypothetical protein